MAEQGTFKKGTFKVVHHTREGKTEKKEVSGFVSSSGLGIHKALNRDDYAIVQTHSGLAISYARTLKEAKEKANNLGGVTNWKRKIKPTANLRRRVKAAEEGKKVSGRLKNDYSIKAYTRKKPEALVEQKKAEGYKEQMQKRGEIRRDMNRRHIGYKARVINETKHKVIKWTE